MKNKKIKKIAYLTGTRADFGLMTPVLKAIQKDRSFNLKVFVTGMHLMPKFGLTAREVKKEFSNAVRVSAVFDSDSKKSLEFFKKKLIPLLEKKFFMYKPDLVLVLGDRMEMLCAAIAARHLGVPIAHIHGGDKTTTLDDERRYVITKLSQIHFAATDDSARRLKKAGIDKKQIFVTGAPAIDIIKKTRLVGRKKFFAKLGLNPAKKVILITQHPVSEAIGHSAHQVRQTIAAAKTFRIPIVIIYPNADPGSTAIIKEIAKERKNLFFRIFKSLP